MDLAVTQLSFTLVATQNIKIPAYPGSILRGALGRALRSLTCKVKQSECKDCNLNQMCAYAQLFNPHLTAEEKEKSSNRFNNKPRPFVFESQTNGQEIFKSGQQINFNLNLFGYTSRFLPYIIESWRLLEQKGLGMGRGKFILSEIWNINQLAGKAERVYSQYANLVHNSDLQIAKKDIDKLKSSLSNEQLKLRLKTPMLLKYRGDYVKRLEFQILMKNLFRRLTSLSLFYGEEELEIDFGAYFKAAEEVELVEDKTEWQTWQRYSSQQRKKIKMQGLSGEVRYRGELNKFLDYLILGQYIHIGKNTVFGLGDYKLLN